MDIKTQKQIDMQIESEIAAWMDRHFYARLSCSAERVHDLARQYRGADVVLAGKITIDEKAKYKSGLFNRVIDCIGFEISKWDRDGVYRPGWLIQKDSLTTHYLILSIFSTAPDFSGITKENIYKIHALLVSKKTIKGIQTETVGDDQTAFLQARGMVEYQTTKYRYIPDKVWMTHTPKDKYPEEPVNLVITREHLKAQPDTREYVITPDGIQRE